MSKLKKIRLYAETTGGAVPSNPKAYLTKLEGQNVKITQDTEEINLFGANGEASEKGYGAKNVAGDIPMVWGADNAPFFLKYGIGAPLVQNSVEAGVAWVTATAYAIGDEVDHTDGLHTLVVVALKGTGTSGATIPDLTAYTTDTAGRGELVVDNAGANQLTWVIIPRRKAWTASTAYPVGKIVNHSDGVHSLVVYSVAGTGTSALAEPVLTDLDRGDTIVDNAGANQITWMVMPLMVEYFGERSPCLDYFGLEASDAEGCAVGTENYSRYQGLRVNTLNFAVTGASMSIKTAVGVDGLSKADSILDAGFVALEDTAGYTEQELEDDFFSFDSSSLLIDDVAVTELTDLSINITQNVSSKPTFNGGRKSSQGVISVSGNVKAYMDNQRYIDAKNHVNTKLELEFTKVNGARMSLKLPQYKMDEVDKMYDLAEDIALDIPFNAHGTLDSKSVYWSATSPISL